MGILPNLAGTSRDLKSSANRCCATRIDTVQLILIDMLQCAITRSRLKNPEAILVLCFCQLKRPRVEAIGVSQTDLSKG